MLLAPMHFPGGYVILNVLYMYVLQKKIVLVIYI